MIKRISFLWLFLSFFSCAQDKPNQKTTPLVGNQTISSSKDIPSNPLKNAYFGETHLHTSYSMDAFIGGNRLSANDAYRFAQGEEIKSNGRMMKIKYPLDFCAVTDHAEYIGEVYTMTNPNSPGYNNEVAKQMREASDYKTALGLFVKYIVNNSRSGQPKHPEFYQGIETTKSAWKINQEATERHNKPGVFTTFHAFEWSAAPKAGNLHRNIIFRDNVLPDTPYSLFESSNPVDLWNWMNETRSNGSTLLAIPHNSNGSKGLMFPETQLDGSTIDTEYLKNRFTNEPLIEMMQIKGNSEVYPDFWQNDEFADFENAKSIQNYSGRTFEKQNYVRYGLTRGLKYQITNGINPFKYGFVGGSDNHNGLPGNVAEDNYFVGSHGYADNNSERRAKQSIDGWAEAYDVNPGAITGVWASKNTRENIYDAMKSKETFATSGTRIKVRFFASNNFPTEYSNYENMVNIGYQNGVPMGGDMKIGKDEEPQFIVWAGKDPNGPNLDRIQIIKGWIEDGILKDKIFNVIASDGREIKEDGSLQAIDAPIDITTGQFNTEKGAAELMSIWKDPEFNPNQHAYYYVRVLELPSARWNLYDEIRNGVKFPDNVKKQIVERAWSSPIWYSPEN